MGCFSYPAFVKDIWVCTELNDGPLLELVVNAKNSRDASRHESDTEMYIRWLPMQYWGVAVDSLTLFGVWSFKYGLGTLELAARIPGWDIFGSIKSLFMYRTIL